MDQKFVIKKDKEKQYDILIDGINIKFPYKPYEVQIEYMKRLIELCSTKIIKNNYEGLAALESPTGTGKTLSLLCSLLAWLNEMDKQKKYKGKIIYATRTHSQISQIMKELKKTCYIPQTAILSSREYSCINENFKNKENMNINRLNFICRKIRKKYCKYTNEFSDNLYLSKYNLVDIEDLFIKGQKEFFCPFYLQIEKSQNIADIIFMPYNYLFNEEIRNCLKLDIHNNIIIIDEAHNIRNVCEKEKSFEISGSDFQDIIKELNELLNIKKNISNKKENDQLKSISPEEINNQIILVEKIKNKICNDLSSISFHNNGKSISYDDFIYLITSSIEKLNNTTNIFNDEITNSLDSTNKKVYIQLNIALLELLKNSYEFYNEKQSKIFLIIQLLSLSVSFLNNKDIYNSYYLYICKERNLLNMAENIDIIIKIFCFNPGIAFQEIIQAKPLALILTSGTLRPFDILENELGIKFNISFESKHIINKNQFKFTIIKEADYGGIKTEFRFDLSNRNNENMIISLGETILNLCKTKNNGGILVFFPSYKFLHICYDIWNNHKINEKIKKYKSIILDEFKIKMLSNKLINFDNKNYILLSVHRGSSSEGINFSDDNARMVICIGVPFANLSDDKIKKKLEYLDKKAKNEKKYFNSRNKWYEVDAMINVNQSLGRVIRHKNDYGIMICIDKRFTFYSIKKLFSNWISENIEIKSLKENDIYFEQIKNFYEFCKFQYPNQINDNFENESFSLIIILMKVKKKTKIII